MLEKPTEYRKCSPHMVGRGEERESQSQKYRGRQRERKRARKSTAVCSKGEAI